jgi:hypothetical protein
MTRKEIEERNRRIDRALREADRTMGEIEGVLRGAKERRAARRERFRAAGLKI